MIRPPVADQDGFPAEEPGAPLREYLAVLRFRKWSILGITLLVVASALFFSLRQTPIYESEAKVLVEPVSVTSTSTGVVPNLETERELVASTTVAALVAQDLGLAEDPASLLEDLEVTVSPNTEILLIRYGHPDPVKAQRLARSFAESYLEFRRQKALSVLEDAQRSVQTRIDALSRELRDVRRQIARESDPGEKADLETEADLLVSRIGPLQADLSELTAPQSLQVGQITVPANLPSSPASPNHPLNLALALFVGLALGVGLAFLRERLDDRLQGREDLETRAGAPVLAVIPHVGSWKKRRDAPVVTLDAPRAASSEAYRTLRTGLLFLASKDELKTVLVTSAQAEDGKTATVANLAVVLAQAGKRVVAVSADLRKPRLHRFFGADNRIGLTNVLAGEVGAAETVVRPEGDNVAVLPSGPVPGNPAELLGSDEMGKLLAELRETADFVLIDCTPMLSVADALTMAPLVDAVLLVADAERTSRHAVAHARQQLDQVNARVLGAVLNNFDPAKARPSPYYQYYYTYRSDDGAPPPGRSAEAEKKEEGPTSG